MNTSRGELIDLEVERVGNGGVCIARHDGIVVLVRLALPGELVRARVTAVNARMLRADTVEVLRPSPHRVSPPCPYAGRCGGCDWQHASIAFQRELKAHVVIEQMSHGGGVTHFGGIPLDALTVRAMSTSPDGLRWRTRNRFHRSKHGGLGLYVARSKDVVEVQDCLISTEGSLAAASAAAEVLAGDIATVATSTGVCAVDPRGGPIVTERVGDRDWRIHASGFWQVHASAAADLAAEVLRQAQVAPGETVLDLYAGAGLFAGCIAAAVPSVGEVVAVESGIDAVRDARRSLADLGAVSLVTADVPAWLREHADEAFDVVVADPPRAGVGVDAARSIAAMARRAIVYVACEPSSLARDTRILLECGWELADLAAFDAFPMTSHVECVALFTRPGAAPQPAASLGGQP